MKLTNTIVEQEYERCGNCRQTHFSHLIVPDMGTDICPSGTWTPDIRTRFRPATLEDLKSWGAKWKPGIAAVDVLLGLRG